MHPWQLFGLFNTHSRRFSAILQPSFVWAHPPSSSAHNHPETIGFGGLLLLHIERKKGSPLFPLLLHLLQNNTKHTSLCIEWLLNSHPSQHLNMFPSFLLSSWVCVCIEAVGFHAELWQSQVLQLNLITFWGYQHFWFNGQQPLQKLCFGSSAKLGICLFCNAILHLTGIALVIKW